MVCEAQQASLGILCVGNALHGDDGFGEAVFEAMRQRPLPDRVRLVCLPFVGEEAMLHVDDCDHVIVVDALQGFGAPGSVHELLPGDIADENAAISHGAGLGAWLAALPAWLDTLPQIEIIGVEAVSMAPFAPGLSRPVETAVPAVCARLMERI